MLGVVDVDLLRLKYRLGIYCSALKRKFDSCTGGTDMSELYTEIQESAAFIGERARTKPLVGIVLGSGLDELASSIDISTEIPYQKIPHFPVSTVSGFHEGILLLGELSGVQVVAMKGRVHYYEGYTMKDVVFPVRVMRALGAGRLILTSAVGGMNPHLAAGDIVTITDHINLMGDNPLIGPNDERLGPRFPDMSEPYDREMIRLLEETALSSRIRLERAVLVAVAGPNLETAAEYRFLRRIGADVVGMSMVPETIAAVHGGMKVLGMSVVTDKALPDCLEPVDIASIVATAKRGSKKLSTLVAELLKRL